jgi:hypothetical protein
MPDPDRLSPPGAGMSPAPGSRLAMLNQVAFIFALLLATCIVACGTAEGMRTSSNPAQRSPASFSWQNPFIPYGMAIPQQRLIERALAKVLSRCLATYGLALPSSTTVSVDPEIAATTSSAATAQWLSVAQSEQDGYLPPGSATTQGQLQPLDGPWDVAFKLPRGQGALFDNLSALLRGTINSYDNKPVPEGGCVRWATDDLDGHKVYSGKLNIASDPDGLLFYLDQLAVMATDSDSRVQRATTKWRDCMRIAGYRYTSPSAAESDSRWISYASAGLTRQELVKEQEPVAYADAQCRYSSNYSKIRATVFTSYAQKYLTAHTVQLQHYRAELLRMIHVSSILVE